MAVQDESALIWYSGSEEKRLWLNAVSRIVPGQRTVSTFCSLFLSTVVKEAFALFVLLLLQRLSKIVE
jgi:hypothetical protein